MVRVVAIVKEKTVLPFFSFVFCCYANTIEEKAMASGHGFDIEEHKKLLAASKVEKVTKSDVVKRPERSKKVTDGIKRLSANVRMNSESVLTTLGWSWNELARRMKVGSSVIYAVKNGSQKIGTATVARMAAAFSLPVEWLFMDPQEFSERYSKSIK